MIGVRDVPERSWYEVTVDGEPAGHATYRDDGEVRVFLHTEVDDSFEGQGVGSALAQGALEDVRASGRTLVPRCPFIASYIDRHPEYAGLVSSQGSRPRG
jgi:predicted GNAT family acetyltransferase